MRQELARAIQSPRAEGFGHRTSIEFAQAAHQLCPAETAAPRDHADRQPFLPVLVYDLMAAAMGVTYRPLSVVACDDIPRPLVADGRKMRARSAIEVGAASHISNSRIFVIVREVLGRDRPPKVERIFCRRRCRHPRRIFGNIIYVV